MAQRRVRVKKVYMNFKMTSVFYLNVRLLDSHYNLFKNVSGHRAILKALQKNSNSYSIIKSEW